MRRVDRLNDLAVLGLLLLLLVPQVSAHAPLMPGSNENLATATVVPDPTKSWAIYAQLHEGGEAQYYRFDISEGQRIHISLLKSTRLEEQDFVPSVVLMGPGLVSQRAVPSYVEVPRGGGTVVVEGKMPARATYEAFSPSAFYQLADFDMDAPGSGTYYVAVFELSQGGHYGLAIGDRESFTLSEWTLAPFNFISIYQWEGQSLLLILAPAAVTIVVGMAFLITRRKTPETALAAFRWAGALAGLFFLATAFTVITQMLYASSLAPVGAEIGITLIFALVPLVLGVVTIRMALRRGIRLITRLGMVIAGLIALFTWSGFIVGPILSLVTSILPSPVVTAESNPKTES